MQHRIITLTAAICLVVAAPAPAATANEALSTYLEPADYLSYVQPKGSFRPGKCANSSMAIRAFRHNGSALLDPTAIPGRDAFKWGDGHGGAVVWNAPTRRFRNYTSEPVIVAVWCAKRSR